MKLSNKRGFTLVELLVVIVILAILGTVGMTVYSSVQKNVRDAKRKADISAIAKAYEVTYNDTGGIYRPLAGSDFATGAIPTPPEGGSYSGLLSANSSGFRVCAPLEGSGQTSCSISSASCHCQESTKGKYIASASPSPSASVVIPPSSPVPSSPPTLNPMPANFMVFNSNRSGHHEIYAMDLSTNAVYQLTNNASYDSWWARLSPDRTKILFYRNPPGQSDQYDTTNLWMMNADGTNQHLIIAAGGYGWAAHGHGEWLRDNNHLIMFGGPPGNLQIIGTDINGANAQIFTIRTSPNLDPSPNLINDSNFLFVGCASACAESNYEIYVVSPKSPFVSQMSDLGAQTQLTNDSVRDQDPYYSPDNTKIAWLRNSGSGDSNPNGVYWSIWIMDANGSNKTPVIADNYVNSRPEWSKDGQWIYFHRFNSGKFDIFKIHPNGTSLTPITVGQSGTNEYPSL